MLFPEIPLDFAALGDDELNEFAEAMREALARVAADPDSFASEELPKLELLAAAREGAEALKAARAELAVRAEAAAAEEAEEGQSDEEIADEFSAIAELTAEDDEDAGDDEGEAELETAAVEADPEPEAVEAEPVEAETLTAAAAPAKPVARRAPPKPAPSRRAKEERREMVPLTASAQAPGFDPGQQFPSLDAITDAMMARRRNFGLIPEGTRGEKIPIARADWSHLYPEGRRLGEDALINRSIVAAALPEAEIKRSMKERRDKSLTASGGLCAPVTPYYQLQMLSVADRPVRAGLPAFNADRGGIRYAAPASLSDITSAVGVRTAAEDGAGGTFATKTCQVVDCPPFTETDVQIIYHCLQFGNLGARTFPELLTQWNQLTLSAHSRLAESELLTGIDTASTPITAHNLGLGASATLFSQIMAAASGMRSRHRMASDSVLRLMLPWWSVYLIVSDVMRGQFDRWDVDQARVVALLRSIDVEPSFYIDSASGRGQVWGVQSAGKLMPFPDTVVWYLFPESSFLYLDGGVLELGLVRDSVLNSTNDFQLFGETFENVAFIGIESLAVASTVCDSGTVSLPHNVTCPIDYASTTS